MLELKLRLRYRAVDMYKSCALIGVVALNEGLGGLFGEAERGV